MHSLQSQHESEIEAIKGAFEKELRKAEKHLRKTSKQEEHKLNLSVSQVESQRDSLQRKLGEEVEQREA